ncbi:MAG: hypothetical protein AB8I69_19275, partial [Anaerolineae bacterium]
MRKGTSGVRRDGAVGGIVEPRAFTFQHIVWSGSGHIDELDDIRVFVPNEAYRPTLYGSLLLLEPEDNTPLILQGTKHVGGANGWTRAGGTAEPVIPGSPVPHFPAGGINFDGGYWDEYGSYHRGVIRRGMRGPRDATMTELEVMDRLGTGILDAKATLADCLVATVNATGLGLAEGDFVRMTDGSGTSAISAVLKEVEEKASTTLIHVETNAADLDIATGVELHVLGAPVSTEYLNPVSSDGISTAGSTEAYGVGDLLRLTQSPSAKGLALIAHLEMCVEVGETLIGLGMALPLTIALANQGGMPRRVTIPIVQEVDFTLTINDATAAGALIPSLPGVGDAITLTDQNGLTLAVVVTAINSDPSGNVRDVDRDLSGLDTNGDILWQPLTRDADDLGPWGYSINPDRVVQYEPPDIRTTPPAGFLWIEDSSTPDAIIAVREITGFRYDAFILDTPLPGTVTDLYTVQRLAGQDGPYDVNTIEESQALLFNSPASINRFTAVVEATGLDLDEGDFVLLMDGGGHRGISEVLSAAEVNGETRVGVGSCAAVMGTNIRLQVLDAPASAEALNSAPNKDDAFDVANATGLYTIGNVLRLVQGTTMEKAVLIEGLEARVEVDEAFPAGMQPPFTIAHALQMGQRQTVNAVALPQTVDFTGTNNIPSVDDAITLTDQAGLILAVIVTAIDPADPNGNTLIVDRDLSSLDTANPVSWRPLVRSRELGSWGDAPPIDAFMTYTPPAVHKAPTAGFLLVEDANTPPQAVVREIKNIDYDAIVTDVPLPGDIAQPYDVLCFVPQQSAKPVRTIDYERELIFDSPLDTDDAAVMQVQWLTDPTLNGAAFSDQLSDPAVVGSPVVSIVGGSPVAMLSFNPLPNPTPDWQHKDWPRPSQVVLLVPTGGGDREAALVKQLRMTFTFDRQLTVSNEGLKLIPLEEGSPRYKARQLGPLVIEFETEQPFLTPVAVGDSLDVDWGGSENQFRVADVEGTGTTLTLEGGAEQPVSVNITGETDIVQAHVVAQPTVIVDPLVDVGGNPCRAQMPRFGIDEIVQGNWAAGTQAVLVTKVNGRQITVVNPNAPVIDNTDPNTPILDETNTATPVTDGLTICRLVPSDPDTGGSRAGVAGEPIGGTPDGENRTATNCIQFQIWHPKPLNSSLQAVILDGNTVLPANVDSAVPLNLEIVFADPPKIAAEGDVTANILKPEIAATCYATHLIPGSNDSVIMSNFWPDESTALADNASHMAIAIPFRKMTDPERTVKGVLQAGTTRIPADPDGEELTRRQSLIEHELIHTRQFIQWGQMMLSPFPLWLLELCFEGGTSVEEYPHFSDWTNATLEVHNSRRTIQIDSPPVTFADDDCVQVFHGQTPTIGELKEPVEGEQNKFFIDIDSDVPNGAILVRRCEPSGGDLTAEVFLNILQPLSVGGVLNTLVGSTYAALLWLLGKGLYACIPNLESATPATVEADEEGNKKILRLANEKGRDILRGATRVIVQSGGSTIVRVVDTIDGDVVKLKSAVDFEGQVNVSPYATHAHGNVFDWYSYYPAQVPDSNQPSTIRLFDVNGKSLTLAIHDRVTIARPEDKWYSWGFRTTVIAVNADGTIDLKDPPPTSGEARDLRIAKVAEEDPLGWVDGWIMNEFGMGWLRFFFDPYGHIHFRASPEPGSGWDIPLRIVRYMFGTRSWSPVMLGSLLWFNLAYQPNNGHLAEMEQEAAQESGDLYSPIGRLEGTLDVVGDVARYWYFL